MTRPVDEPVGTQDSNAPEAPEPDRIVRARATVAFSSAPVPILSGIALLGLCVLSGAFATALGLLDLRVARESTTWPSTRGIVLSAAPAAASAGPGAPLGLRYRYDVDGRAYESSRITFGAEPTELARSYRMGSEVVVHYDAGRPELAVLEPGGSLLRMDSSFYVAIVSLLGGAAGLAWLLTRIAWRA